MWPFFFFGCLFRNLKLHFFLLRITNNVTRFFSNQDGIHDGGKSMYLSKQWNSYNFKKVLPSLETFEGFGKIESDKQHSPSTIIFLSFSPFSSSFISSYPRQIPNELHFVCLFFLFPFRSSVCLSIARHTFPTHTHCLACLLFGPTLFFFLSLPLFMMINLSIKLL